MVMAVGGVLRAALRAGNWARAAAQSRRQARALAQLSEGFSAPRGRFGPEGAVDYLSARGVDPAFPAQFAPMAGGRMFRGPFGRDTFLSDAGGRVSQARGQYSPIVAPYEGFRVLPGGYDARYGETMIRPGPWMGRGRGTDWGELPLDGGPPYDSGTYWEQFPGPNRGAGGFGNPFDGIRPTYPWTAFGDWPSPYPPGF